MEDSTCWPCKSAEPRPELRQTKTLFWVHLIFFVLPTFGASIAILVTLFVLKAINFTLEKSKVDWNDVPWPIWLIIAVFVLPLIPATWTSARLLWLSYRQRLASTGLCAAQLVGAIMLIFFRLTTVYLVPLDLARQPIWAPMLFFQEIEQLVYVALFYVALDRVRHDLDRLVGSQADLELSLVSYVDGEPFYLRPDRTIALN